MSEKLTRKAPSDVRIGNISAIFNLLFPARQISRVELGNRIGLSRMATSGVTGEMIQNHILCEIGEEPRKGRGKRSQILAVDPSYWRIATLDLSDEFVFKGALIDLRGSIIRRVEQPSGNTPQERVEHMLDLCKTLVGLTKLPVLGIGIALSGIVNSHGTVVCSVLLGWNDLPVRDIVEKATGITTIVSNDTNVSLVAEHYFGNASANSILITVAGGVGASLYINNHIVCGDTFAAGEIGHVIVDPQGEQCSCGRRGCLETRLAEPKLRARIAQSPLQREQILHDAGRLLATTIAVAVGLLNVREIALYGASDIVGNEFISGVQEGLNADISPAYGAVPTAYRCSQGEDLVLRGQAVEVIRELVPNIHGSDADSTKEGK